MSAVETTAAGTEAADTSPQAAAAAAPGGQGRLATLPLYPLLLAAYPVLLLYADNTADVAATEVIVPLAVAVLATALIQGALTLLWRSARRAAIVTTALTLPFFLFGLLAEVIAPMWPHEPIVRAYLTAMMVWLAIAFLSFYVASRIGRRLGTLTSALNVVAAVLVVLTLVPIASYAISTRDTAASTADTASALVAGDGPVAIDDGRLRDIYHLVFDRYGSQTALRLGPGIDNGPFVAWLEANGFQVSPDARANFERTALSLSSVLSMSLHEALAAEMGPGNPSQDPLIDLIRASRVGAFLQDLGYTYHHVGSWFYPTAQSTIADRVIEPGFTVDFASTLRDRTAITGLESIAAMVTTLSIHGTDDRLAHATAAQFESIAELVDEPGPKYVFAHFLVPHEPYLFLEDGSFAPDEATFETQLRYTNAQVRRILARLLALPEDEQPIIILQADEGPYPSRYALDRDAFDWTAATDAELATKFGVLDAMYLPGPEGEASLPEGMSLVNTYPEVLRRYFDVEVSGLPDRSFALRDGALYDLIDITEPLDAAITKLVED